MDNAIAFVKEARKYENDDNNFFIVYKYLH